MDQSFLDSQNLLAFVKHLGQHILSENVLCCFSNRFLRNAISCCVFQKSSRLAGRLKCFVQHITVNRWCKKYSCLVTQCVSPYPSMFLMSVYPQIPIYCLHNLSTVGTHITLNSHKCVL